MNPNPDASPNTHSTSLCAIVDRTQRDDLATLVRRFLDEDVSAFDLDELLDDFHSSPDGAIRFVAGVMWCYYDDCADHLVALSKPEWDYLQRLLLLLESDRCVQTVHARRWSWTQLVAFGALLGFVEIAFPFGWGFHLLVAAIPFGIVSVGISWLRHTTADVGPYDLILFPFATFSDLRSAYDAVNFKKTHYPQHIQTRTIRSPFKNAIHHLQFYMMWLVLSPIALAFQMLPATETQTRVIAE